MEKLQALMKNRKKTYVERTPNDIYRDVAEGSDLTAKEVAAIGGLESQHGEFRKPIKGGSARGLFQFQPDTAEDLIPGSSENINDMNTQAQLMKLYLEKNKVNNAEDAFVKHNLGNRRGTKFLQASDDTNIREVIPSRVINANPGIYDVETVGEAKEIIKQKLEKGTESSKIRPNFLDLFRRDK